MASNFKKISNGVNLVPQTSAPSSPEDGDIYYDSTLNKFRKYENGNWQDLGSGSGGGGKNYLSPVTTSQSSTPNTGNGDFELGSTTGWSLGTTGTLTNGLPTGTPTFGSGASGNLSISAVSSGQLAGTYSLSYTSSAATTQGDMLASDAFYIDSSDQAKVLTWKFYYKAQTNPGNANWSGTSSNSFGVAVWDVTNSAWLPTTAAFGMTQSSGVGVVSGTVQTASNAAQLRLVVYNVNATSGAITLYFDDFSFGPQTAPLGAAVTDWQTFTPTGTWVTNTTYAGKWRRVGDSAEIQVDMTMSGSPSTGLNLLINMPPGLSIDVNKVSSTSSDTKQLGISGCTDNASNTFINGKVMLSGTLLAIYGTNLTGANSPVTQTFPFTFGANDRISILLTVPISGWSSNVQMSNDTDTRVASFYVTRGTNQTGVNPNDSSVKINFDSVVTDTHGSFSTSGYKYTIPVSGYWKFNIGLDFGITNVLNNHYGARLYINGSFKETVSFQTPAATSFVFLKGDSTPFLLNAGDYVEVYLFGTGNNSANTLTIAASTSTFSGFRLSGPAVIAASESVAARYTSTAGQSIPTSSPTTIDFGTKDYDSHGSVTTGGSWKFTAPISGKFSVKSYIQYAGASFTTENGVTLDVYKNGVFFSRLFLVDVPRTGTQTITVAGSDSINLLAGDYIDLRTTQVEGTNRSLTTSAGLVRIAIERIGN